MKPPYVLITGGLGCIGAETAKWLVRHSDAHVVISSRRVSSQRVDMVFRDVDQSRLSIIAADVTDACAVKDLLSQHQITHVAHMAALQTPDCNAHRDLGLQINLAGTQNLIEAMKSTGILPQRFLFASSIAVYGPRDFYAGQRVPMLAEPKPVNVYGTWKLAGEHLARLFFQECGVPTISLRPGVLFGPGRDAGLTSTPTTAMKSVALGLEYEIPFQSRQDYQYAPDVGAAVAISLLEPFEGYAAFTLPGRTVDTAEMVASLRRAATELGIAEQFKVSIGKEQVPFICDLDFEPFVEQFPNVPHTPLDQAVLDSLRVFRDQVSRGWLTAESVTAKADD